MTQMDVDVRKYGLDALEKESISLMNNAATLLHILHNICLIAGPMKYLQASTEARRLQKGNN